ncbi:PaaI family thioesterase [Alicyclobacillus cycloheptanicus]|uniref:Acyl-coenzyme A thioesterase THEM4 n=1 Tax=Alicyclobacillus cycloheptanicus TaxID=1457 RepID=A0ABT9XG21_9BACL|nr:PaaI family thioesterase [Alicyclobacillus cycloheptanicus]MDQ0189019.1 uncharacterized protein (TIGR00369 family) [Alicyclobacillus cycloheptanicus]WDM01643.1 PaaI family thioesterase [Alicyclobacillus cycloheptanicus]
MGYATCFVCGQENDKGLHIHFHKDGENGVRASFLAEPWHEGWPGIQHGGVTSAILDEATAYVTFFMGVVAVTAQLQVEFQDPIRVGERVEIEAHPTKVTRRIVEVDASIRGTDGALKARSHAKMMILSQQQKEEMGLANLP